MTQDTITDGEGLGEARRIVEKTAFLKKKI